MVYVGRKKLIQQPEGPMKFCLRQRQSWNIEASMYVCGGSALQPQRFSK